MNSACINLAIDLIARPSVTPEDEGCQDLLTARLEQLGFNVKQLNFGEGENRVKNFWARKGTEAPLLCFAGHTDVVPTGPIEEWSSHPFQPSIKDNKLYGRGSADMKGSIAAFICALEHFLAEYANHQGSIALLITADEEGPAIHGTKAVMEHLNQCNEKIDYCIVGEPSSSHELGDIIKNGRRGSLSGALTIIGQQGHVAYPHLVRNPIHLASAALAELAAETWDQGNEFFPPTSFQISNIAAGTGATNVVPGRLNLDFNFRFSTEITPEQLQTRVEAILEKHQLKFNLDWNLSGLPFLTAEGNLVAAASSAIKEVTNRNTQLSTSGGTSDGRFIAPTGAEVVELGPLNTTIHQIDEHVAVDDLDNLSLIYEKIIKKLLVT